MEFCTKLQLYFCAKLQLDSRLIRQKAQFISIIIVHFDGSVFRDLSSGNIAQESGQKFVQYPVLTADRPNPGAGASANRNS